MEQPDRLVLFDGVCNFCNFWIQFALKRDKKGKLKFGSLQGTTAQEILPKYNIDPTVLTSVIFIEDGVAYRESTAALKVCRHLDGGWKLLYVLIIIPAFIRDGIYKWVGRNRYKWFGKQESCMLPTPEQRARFVE
ncbi:putative DCC family thiol-disulfide oxidoreductase YuxK [Lacibacter cauensis]|uniref:Putative DCC family thiol-disulfide oxidoreductase YuxK n=1 Tax=Lacibacter cauensis TaxID=510947 RepID=A0A562SU71_9BACT|nr:thiol-disulfide oxidoreductase DCC family protein [Lacibacter cauensis]TWI84861.1 putative DCC family thiol-disulfide oxidoreductase YuxK [Lacibacter cauensis]